MIADRVATADGGAVPSASALPARATRCTGPLVARSPVNPSNLDHAAWPCRRRDVPTSGTSRGAARARVTLGNPMITKPFGWVAAGD